MSFNCSLIISILSFKYHFIFSSICRTFCTHSFLITHVYSLLFISAWVWIRITFMIFWAKNIYGIRIACWVITFWNPSILLSGLKAVHFVCLCHFMEVYFLKICYKLNFYPIERKQLGQVGSSTKNKSMEQKSLKFHVTSTSNWCMSLR